MVVIGERPTPVSWDVAAFEASYTELFEPVLRYTTRRLGRTAGEDVCAQAFTEAWKHRDRFDPTRGSVRAWVFGIATNLIREHYRSEQRRLRAWAALSARSDSVDVAEVAADRVDAARRYAAVAEALADLRDVDRELLWLRATAGLTYAELAQVCGIEVGTVRSRLSRAKRRVQDRINETAATEAHLEHK